MKIRVTKEPIESRLKNEGYSLIKIYREKGLTKVILKDDKNYKYDIIYDNFRRGQGVSFVSTSNKFSIENISLWIKLNEKEFTITKNNVYKNSSSLLELKCSNCKQVFLSSWDKIHGGSGCHFCSSYAVGKYNSLSYMFPELVKEWDYDKNSMSPETVFPGSDSSVWWKCKCCRNSWKAMIRGRALGGNGCPSCNSSRGELAIKKELSRKNISFIEQKRFKELGKLSFDFYLPDISLCIEYNGEQHYRPTRFNSKTTMEEAEQSFIKQKERDNIKKEFCRKNKIALLVIPYTELKNINDILKICKKGGLNDK